MTEGQKYVPYRKFNGSVVPNCIMKRKDLSHGAKLCFARLAQYGGKDGFAYPSQDTLAEELGVTRRTVRNYIKELEDKSLLKTVHRGKNVSNAYVFIWNSEILESLDEEKKRKKEELDTKNLLLQDDEDDSELNLTGHYTAIAGRDTTQGVGVITTSTGRVSSHKENQLIESNKENQLIDDNNIYSHSIIYEKDKVFEMMFNKDNDTEEIINNIVEEININTEEKDFAVERKEEIINSLPVEKEETSSEEINNNIPVEKTYTNIEKMEILFKEKYKEKFQIDYLVTDADIEHFQRLMCNSGFETNKRLIIGLIDNWKEISTDKEIKDLPKVGLLRELEEYILAKYVFKVSIRKKVS